MSERAADIAFRAGFRAESLKTVQDPVIKPIQERLTALRGRRANELDEAQKAVHQLEEVVRPLAGLVEHYREVGKQAEAMLAEDYVGDGFDGRRAILVVGVSLLAWWSASLLLADVLRTNMVLFERLRVFLGLALTAGAITLFHLLCERIFPTGRSSERLHWVSAALALLLAVTLAPEANPNPLRAAALGLVALLSCLVGLRRVDWRQSSAAGRYLERRREQITTLDAEWRQARDVLASGVRRVKDLQSGSLGDLLELERSELVLARRMAESYELGRLARREAGE
ncbi:MAG TPA: hypothetical protein VHG35_04370 [Gemmatimonadales bacterium]|nr:hypothetical protein [Gemmatimonadales bacterium]